MKKRSYSIIFYPLTVCALILFVFWQQTNTPDPLHFISPTTSPGTHPENAANPPHQTNPDALRPSIQLHPEDHIHRAPTAQHLDWTVTADYIRPDGVLKRVYLINGAPLPPFLPRVANTNYNRPLSRSNHRSAIRRHPSHKRHERPPRCTIYHPLAWPPHSQ